MKPLYNLSRFVYWKKISPFELWCSLRKSKVKEKWFDHEFEGYDSSGLKELHAGGSPTYCGFLPAEGEHKSEDQDEIDSNVESSGMLKTVDALNPAKNKFTKEKLKRFLSEFDHTHMDRSKPKGLAYLIIDDVAKFFKLSSHDLKDARREAEEHVDFVCKEAEPQ